MKLQKMLRYQPSNRSEGTRITWSEENNLIELYHEESDCYFHIDVKEVPTIVEALQQIKESVE